LVEHWSPKPGVGSSSLSTRAIKNKVEMRLIINYVRDSLEELKNNVSWTSRSELQRLVSVVLVFSVLFSLAIWGADTVLSRIVKFYFELIG
jgi:preprotein translocase subunit SecE|tara:strand:- start:633 stop:905 length:273 start_codon:yes stop_codon:yes gene_type:complete